MKDLDKRLGGADAASEKRDSDLRKELLDQSQQLRDDVNTARSEMTDSLGRTAGELRDAKADRSLIADLFSRMALEMAGEGGGK